MICVPSIEKFHWKAWKWKKKQSIKENIHIKYIKLKFKTRSTKNSSYVVYILYIVDYPYKLNILSIQTVLILDPINLMKRYKNINGIKSIKTTMQE